MNSKNLTHTLKNNMHDKLFHQLQDLQVGCRFFRKSEGNHCPRILIFSQMVLFFTNVSKLGVPGWLSW